MKILIVNAFKDNPEGRKRFKMFKDAVIAVSLSNFRLFRR
jgi:hypothetical protein